MSLHLHPTENAGPAPLPHIEDTFFVIQRGNGHWSPASKVIYVTDDYLIAEAFACQQKKLHPQQIFGVAKLSSEVHIIDTIQIIRTPGEDA